MVPAPMVRAPVVSKIKGVVVEPILPNELRVRSAALIAVPARVVKIEPARALRVRLVPVRVIGEVILISPVVWVREREPAVIVPER